ncbi:hypothetical protein [uncultured Helicobacter sp.]|uniref:hypothetical protein n=1 Tax=uncultured Helicobacter sp. TaxID=175537 RepID=UPI00263891ED|nr:hypothetical protein [uncultured Helicobacter sp.]
MKINNYSTTYYCQCSPLKVEKNKDLQDFENMLNVKKEESKSKETQDNTQKEDKKASHLVSAKEARLLGSAIFINAVRETMRIQGINDPSKIDSAILSEVRSKRHNESDPIKIKAMLEKDLEVLQSPTDIQKGYYMGQIESEARFQDRKNQAIDYVKELLQNIKA